jgi:hypothetical protein
LLSGLKDELDKMRMQLNEVVRDKDDELVVARQTNMATSESLKGIKSSLASERWKVGLIVHA